MGEDSERGALDNKVGKDEHEGEEEGEVETSYGLERGIPMKNRSTATRTLCWTSRTRTLATDLRWCLPRRETTGKPRLLAGIRTPSSRTDDQGPSNAGVYTAGHRGKPP